MSREMYGGGGGGSSQRSPKTQRRDMQQSMGGGQGSPSKNVAVGPMMTSRASPHSQMAPSSVGVGGRSGLSSPQSRIKPTRHVSGTRSSTNSPLTIAGEPTTNSTHFPHSLSGSAFNIPGSGAYYDELGSPVMMDSRSASAPGHHRSRSVGRSSAAFRSYHSLERDPEREFMPIRDPRDRSLDRGGGGGMGLMDGHHMPSRRSDDGRSYMSSRDPGTLYDEDPYRVHGRQSPYNPGDSIISRHPPGSNMNPGMMGGGGVSRASMMDNRGDVVSRSNMMDNRGDVVSRANMMDGRGGGGGGDPYSRERDRDREAYIFELQTQLAELQKDFSSLKKELEVTNQKLGSSMHSIKTFWSPELKKERALRKEESAKYALINDQLKLLNSENQKQSTLIQQLEEELRSSQLRNPVIDLQPQLENIYSEKEHQAKEIYLLRETIKELELRIDTQKQTLHARDESIKKLLEMLQGKSSAVGKLLDEDRIEYEKMKTQLFEAQSRARHLETLLETKDKDIMKTKEVEELKVEISRRDQEIMAMGAKMRTLEEQHQDYQRHIAVLKESLTAKEEHYNMLQTDVEELRQRLEEKNKLIEKKTQQMIQAQQDRNRLNSELSEMKEHMDIKDRKINVLQRKIELHEANEKLQSKSKEGDAQVAQAQKQMEERQKAMDERQKILEEMEKRLKKRKEKLDQLENQMQKAEAGSNEVLAKQIADLRKKNETQEKQALDAKKGLEKAKDDALRAQQDLDRLLQIMQQSEEEKFAKDKQIRDLQEALANVKKSQQAGAQMVAETVRQKDEEAKRETAKAQEQLHRQQERIAELEEALRESVQITAEREIAVAQAEEDLCKAQEKIGKLEQRLKSVQNAHNLRCTNCPSLKASIKELELKLNQLLGERRTHFEELFDMKQDALTAAISERDAHIALLEVSGIKTQKSSEELDRLKNERSELMDKIRQENERRVVLLQNGSLSVEGVKQEEIVELSPNEISNGGTSSSSSSFSSCDEDWNQSQHDP